MPHRARSVAVHQERTCGTAHLQARPFTAQKHVPTPKTNPRRPAGTTRLSSWTSEGRARLEASTVSSSARAAGDGSLLHLAHQADADVVARLVRAQRLPLRRAEPVVIVVPGAAAHHAAGAIAAEPG